MSDDALTMEPTIVLFGGVELRLIERRMCKPPKAACVEVWGVMGNDARFRVAIEAWMDPDGGIGKRAEVEFWANQWVMLWQAKLEAKVPRPEVPSGYQDARDRLLRAALKVVAVADASSRLRAAP